MRQYLPLLTMLVPLTAATMALADVEEHQVEYYWDVSEGNEALQLDFPQFDTAQGSRRLISVSVGIAGEFDLSLAAENLESYPILEGEWFVDSAVLMFFEFDDIPIGPMAGGGLGMYSTDLAAADGNKGQGPDYTEWSYDAHEVTGGFDLKPSDNTHFRGEGTIGATLYPYLDLALSGPPPKFDLENQQHVHVGALTVKYTWESADAALLTVEPFPIIAGEKATITATNLFPNTLTFLALSTRGSGNVYVPFLSVTIDLQNPRQLLKSVMSDGNGVASWSGPAPAKWGGRTIWLQAAQAGLKTNVLEAPIQ